MNRPQPSRLPSGSGCFPLELHVSILGQVAVTDS